MAGKIIDVSAAGAVVNIGGRDITDFLDDATPFQFPDTEVSGVGLNFQGDLIRYARGNPFMMSVTVCSGGDDDKYLRDMVAKYHISKGQSAKYAEGGGVVARIHISRPTGPRDYNLQGGVIVSGPMGPTATGEGKLQGNTYTFAFAKCE